MRYFSIAILILAAVAQGKDVPSPAPKVADGEWANVLKERPRLLGPKSFLRSLAKTKAEAYKEIKTLANNMLAMGIVHAVEGLPKEKIQPFIDAAMKSVARGVTNQHQDTWVWLTDAALALDFFHDEISADDRKKIIDWFNAHLDKFTTDEGAFHNSTMSKILCYIRIAYATWGENAKAKDFREYALTKLYEGKIVPVLKEFGAGGGCTECGWYTRGCLWHLMQALELARRVEKYDGFQKAPQFFYQRLAYEMLQPFPGLWMYGSERYPVEGDGAWTYGGHNEYPRNTRTVLAQYFRGSELARFVANKRRKGSNPESRLIDFLYEEAPDKPLPMTNLPPAHLASGIGRVYARSDWSDDATWFRFECGDFFNHHQHFEVGNFEIFRYEPLATESGEYEDYASNHSVNWLLRTVAHNCMLIYDADERWPQMRDGGKNKYANDGGQNKKWDWTVDTLEEWKKKRDTFERGDIIAYRNEPEFLYVAGDCTKSYSQSKLSSWVRQIVFIRPHTFVIFDRVVSTKPEFEKTWLLHCKNEPQIDGDTITITNGKGKLVVKTLLPEKAKIEKVNGYAYCGLTFDVPNSSQTPFAVKWRVEVKPGTAQVEDLFLHVLFTDSPAPIKLLRKSGQTGVQVGSDEVLFDTKGGGTLSIAGRSIVLRPDR